VKCTRGKTSPSGKRLVGPWERAGDVGAAFLSRLRHWQAEQFAVVKVLPGLNGRVLTREGILMVHSGGGRRGG